MLTKPEKLQNSNLWLNFFLNGHFVTKSLPSTSQAVICTWDPAPGSVDQSIGIHTWLDPRLDCNHVLYVTGWEKCAELTLRNQNEEIRNEKEAAMIYRRQDRDSHH